MGSALNKSQNIAVLHEHYTRNFFDPIELLFRNQDFHSSLGNSHLYEDSIITRERDHIPIIESIFSIVFKKSPSIIGTKFPGLQRWEKAVYPAGMDVREINIIRNPISVVNSYTVKDDGTLSEDPERAFCDWLHSFNYAVSEHAHASFLWLLYEDFRQSENSLIAQRIADFLQIEADFDLADISASERLPAPKFLDAPSGQKTFDAINRLFDITDWRNDAAAKINAAHLIGYPLAHGECIDLTTEGNGWKYIYDGFYAPEADGSWTRGEVATICFTPETTFSGRLHTTLEISWGLTIQGVGTSFSLYLDDRLIGKTSLKLGKSNGGNNLVIFDTPDAQQQSASITLRIVIDNPRNPATLGISADNRELGLMIRSIAFET
ncbi:hypothetical protein MF4836_34400 [Pseudomonas sp. MF4836]|nr:hypothetical protein MF4836_34400 [Pseudomonas sp. MF4836]